MFIPYSGAVTERGPIKRSLRGLTHVAYAVYERRLRTELNSDRIPQHIGVMVDGNRRWAKLAGAPTAAGHRAGADKIVEFIGWCAELNIPTVTLYMLSTDNMNRSEDELEQLMEIIGDTLDRLAESRPGGRPVRVHPVGQPELLPEPLAAKLWDITTATGAIPRVSADGEPAGEDPCVHVNVAVGYGGRQEIVDAVKDLLRDAGKRGRTLAEVAEELSPGRISDWLYTRGQPDPDLIIRTSGEQRLSGFLMWQSAYSEFYFAEALWPDFRRVDFLRALRDFATRQRRFGS
ncbi:di-trans,poly-cis-decaprenylcistransferase [Nesterenkonia alkaliphila]|uniref:Isoprenyl transferase n=1 Tax=Nesterenkonia alkaliphila TaxID=1463631 RepID=A0A7K1UJL8_9MICC|nr:di-trans,poly-cis-decaprenylcistransferase [Nesterenkonia alkaliphila]GFZ92076.1 isoprenyl transferase [Nesterenkonia alkaliphila]